LKHDKLFLGGKILSISEKFRALRGGELYHYTHMDNASELEKLNIVYSKSLLDTQGIKPVHITDISSQSIDKCRGFNNYVFLIFSHSHPLIYKKSNIENISIGYFKIDVSILDIPGVLIADRVATDNCVNFYTPEEALKHLKIQYCHNDRIEDRAIWDEVKKYEILIPNYIDLNKYEREE